MTVEVTERETGHQELNINPRLFKGKRFNYTKDNPDGRRRLRAKLQDKHLKNNPDETNVKEGFCVYC